MRQIFPLLIAVACFAQQPTPDEMPQEMVWVDRAGKILGPVGATQMSMFFPEISPDGKSIAVSARDGDVNRSEERRVGKECRSRWAPCDEKEKRGEEDSGC